MTITIKNHISHKNKAKVIEEKVQKNYLRKTNIHHTQ